MLKTVKQCLAELPDKSFDTHYQEYVMSFQDMLIDSEIARAEQKCSIESIPNIIKELNTLTEEVNQL